LARPRSEDKRNAILQAAIHVFAERGFWSTSTAAISKAAGLAEGTLFTYFSTKDELVNQLYRALKIELAEVLLSELPRSAGIRSKLEYIWNQYVAWGVENPAKYKVMVQLRMSDKITAETRAIGYEPFAEVESMTRESIVSGELRNYPLPFVAAMMGGLAETTMGFLGQCGEWREEYRAYGFEVFWNGIAQK
jgi:AcrR family transcriptional regulator